MIQDNGFIPPWRRNHCGPRAIANVSGTGLPGAERVIRAARTVNMLSRDGAARGMRYVPDLELIWLAPVGYRVVRVPSLSGPALPVVFEFGARAMRRKHAGWSRAIARPGMTVMTMLRRREWKRGRWLVFTARHVFALVDGVPFGYHQQMARVQLMIKVEPVPGDAP